MPLPDVVLMHRVTPLAYLAEEDRMLDVSLFCVLHTGTSHLVCLASCIGCERKWLQDAVVHPPIFELNGE